MNRNDLNQRIERANRILNRERAMRERFFALNNPQRKVRLAEMDEVLALLADCAKALEITWANQEEQLGLFTEKESS